MIGHIESERISTIRLAVLTQYQSVTDVGTYRRTELLCMYFSHSALHIAVCACAIKIRDFLSTGRDLRQEGNHSIVMLSAAMNV